MYARKGRHYLASPANKLRISKFVLCLMRKVILTGGRPEPSPKTSVWKSLTGQNGKDWYCNPVIHFNHFDFNGFYENNRQ